MTTPTLPLYVRRPGDCRPLGAFLRLDLRTGAWDTVTRGQGDGVLMAEWHGHLQVYRVPAEITQAGINSILADPEVKTLAQRLCAGYSSEWDGSNHVAALTPEAEKAERDLDQRIERLRASVETGAVWQIGEWMGQSLRRTDRGWSIDDIGPVTPRTSDARLAAMARKIERLAAHDGIVLEGDAEDWLKELRTQAGE